MSNRISQFQLTDATQWQGLTTENHLGYLYMNDRILTSPLVEDIMSFNYGKDFDDFVDSLPVEELTRDAEFEWLISGPDIKNYPLIDWYDVSGSKPTKPGVQFTRFYMEFPVRMFEETDVIVNGNAQSKEVYQLQVKAEPKPKGTNWVYEVELVTGNQEEFMPVTELSSGTRWAKLYSEVAQTLSEKGGNVIHTGYFKLYNRCSSIRKQYEVPGNMIIEGDNKPMGAVWRDNQTGQTFKTWLNKLDFDFLTEFKREKSYLHLYSKWNKKSDGTYNNKEKSGYEIKSGAGFFQQISPSNVHYVDWDLDILEQILLSMSVGKLPMDQRKFVICTGEWGWRKFHKLVEARGFAFSTMNAGNRITGTGNELRLGGQYVAMGFVNGIEVELRKMPIFDDPNVNTERHPDGGLMSSYEMIIMDIGTTQGKPNLQRMKVKGREEMWKYIPGMADPFTPFNKPSAPQMTVSPKDGYEVLKMYIGGTKLRNPTRVARILPNYR